MGQPKGPRGLRLRGDFLLLFEAARNTNCGKKAADFALGSCGFRWAALLAVIAFVDSIVLGELPVLLSLSPSMVICRTQSVVKLAKSQKLLLPGCLALTLASRQLGENPGPYQSYKGEVGDHDLGSFCFCHFLSMLPFV